LQNFASLSFFVPHPEQNFPAEAETGAGAPQEPQNLAPAAIAPPHLEQVAEEDSTACGAETDATPLVELKTTSVMASRFREATTIKPMSGKRPSTRENQPYKLA
jgi:hypothetical protein